VNDINPHGVRIKFGKHAGELVTRVPVSYLKWMINEKTLQHETAKAEFERRGDTMPKVELSGHAIDNASLRVRKIWYETSNENEGLYSWLQRMTLEALAQDEPIDGKVHYNGMKLVIAEGEEFPTLKTIMRIKA
jgi:hypothetical protein